VLAIRRAQHQIDDANRFLRKLYDADNNNLWYRPFEKEEIYTTMKPDYRQLLKRKYGEKLKQVVKLDSQMEGMRTRLS